MSVMKSHVKKFLLTSLMLVSAICHSAEIKGMRFWQSPDSARVVVDLSDPATHNIFYLDNPERLVVDVEQSKLAFNPADLAIQSAFIKRVRTSEQKGSVRVVLDLKKQVKHKSFALKPYQNYGHRLVIDLEDKVAPVSKPKKEKKVNQPKGLRDIVIAVDAGHGGEDPGAIGAKGTKEKVIALRVAKYLASLINKEPGMKAVLVRSGDYYLSLRKRTQIARRNQADFFVSIHADAFHDKRARGASVWVVSQKGASSEIGRWLEQDEKNSELLGGVEDLSNKDKLLQQVLLDLSTTHTQSVSLSAADEVYGYLRKAVPKMHGNKRVQKASFVVLKNPDIPGILVEMAFISNPKEEKLLRTKSHRRKIAESVFKGLRDYFKTYPPSGTLFANKQTRNYTIRKGDTLSEIASRYGVSMAQLKKANQLKNSQLRVGQKLVIPGSGK
ncbi:N-acetylmuramoyl-L-alanine amidase [Pleionea sp. CnH1-48]|uniref:N-acetylmuramoyl-L-alanine amidase n=1 Tax=Pleionea sp. CnH1-48 TaxID=2954494 RepID=UPI002097D878|nr:N-acetylmuramoyl-L-alanine amidase [Pleionea sp. CnH1-48]MCO7224867.1 N-acetylmuramoyl-L-alanine amidase [Pleionea sp. CnH1-48]